MRPPDLVEREPLVRYRYPLVPLVTTRATGAGTPLADSGAMASTHGPALEQLIGTIAPIVTMERDGLVVIALGATSDSAVPAYLTLDEATQANAVDIHELGRRHRAHGGGRDQGPAGGHLRW